MRTLLLVCSLLAFTGHTFAQGDGDSRRYTRQDLFVACLSGYVGAIVPKGETPDYDESVRIAKEILATIHKYCPAPYTNSKGAGVSDPDGGLNRWMIMVTRELVVLAKQGDSPQMLMKW